jgi:hypothetical protein
MLGGLRSEHTNPNAWGKFISIHNRYHGGSGASFLDHAEHAHDLEMKWKLQCDRTGVSVSHVKPLSHCLIDVRCEMWVWQ